MSDYHALSYKDKIVFLERFEVSSQGVSKLISYHRWNLHQGSGTTRFFCDNKLNEIWASRGTKVWCLRTNGQNQEVNDHSLPRDGQGNNHEPHSALIVGKGKISLFRTGENCHIRFDENGYKRLDPFDFQELNNYIEEGDFEVVLDQYHHPELPEQYVIVGRKPRKSQERKRKSGGYYVDYEGQVTSTDKDDITNYNELVEMLKEHFPDVDLSGNETMTVNWGSSPQYLFSSDAVKLLGRTRIQIAVSKIGEGNPRPRYPMTHAQKTFEEDIRARLDLHESILKEEFSRYFGHN